MTTDPEQPYVGIAPPPRPKFQHRYRRHVVFFLLTFLTTSFAPAFGYFWAALGTANPFAAFTVETFLQGLWYSVPLLTILGAHEFGHYAWCRIHSVDATLPYFIPAPLPLTGTLGAVIRIREPFPSKKALFDIGVAGPIAGFVALLPILYWGITWSEVVAFPEDEAVLYFGEPLLFQAVAWMHFGALPGGHDIALHPTGFAAWWGMLATALNLLPFGQLDGGHIAYAALGRRAAWISGGTLIAAVLLTLGSSSWIAMTVMMLLMAFFLGVSHPRIVDEEAPLDGTRRAVALCALAMLVICFTPVPIEIVGLD